MPDKRTTRLRICHVINDLPVGGAEMMLYKLLRQLDRSEWEPSVVSLIGLGPMGQRIRRLGVAVDAVGMERRLPGPAELRRLCRLIQNRRPHVVQTWLYHANVLGGLTARLTARGLPVIWNIRMNSPDAGIDKRSTLWTMKLGAWMSRWLPERIVINSAAGRDAHAAFGYSADRFSVIPNGFDLDEFQPSDEARRRLRQELGLRESARLVGAVGRDHPHKDYGNFIRAAAAVADRITDVHFVLCGRGLDRDNAELNRWVRDAGLAERFHLLGPRPDIAAVHAALDVGLLSSCTEGFPNVVGEAMACGVPCVVTDVGAAAELVGNTGRVVPRRDSRALAAGCIELLSLPADERLQLGLAARWRVRQRYGLNRICKLYTNLWRQTANGTHAEQSIQLNRAA